MARRAGRAPPTLFARVGRCNAGLRAQHVIVCFEIFGRLGEHPPLFALRHADRQGPGDLSRDLVLQGQRRPQAPRRSGRTRAPGHPCRRAVHSRVRGRRSGGRCLRPDSAPQGCGRSRRGLQACPCRGGQRSKTSRSVGKPAQRVDDVLRQSVGEILASRIVALVQEGENGDRGFRANFGGLDCGTIGVIQSRSEASTRCRRSTATPSGTRTARANKAKQRPTRATVSGLRRLSHIAGSRRNRCRVG